MGQPTSSQASSDAVCRQPASCSAPLCGAAAAPKFIALACAFHMPCRALQGMVADFVNVPVYAICHSYHRS